MASSGLINQGFETGNLNGWSMGTVMDFAGVVVADSYTTPYHGSYMARLGTPRSSGQPIGSNTIYQEFTLLDQSISFAYNIFTYDATNDHFHYKVTDINSNSIIGYYAQTAWGSANTLKSTGWRTVTLDLSGYLGKQLKLEFDAGGNGDTLYPTWAYIDSIPTPDTVPPTTTVSTNSI